MNNTRPIAIITNSDNHFTEEEKKFLKATLPLELRTPPPHSLCIPPEEDWESWLDAIAGYQILVINDRLPGRFIARLAWRFKPGGPNRSCQCANGATPSLWMMSRNSKGELIFL